VDIKIVIPTFNAGEHFKELAAVLLKQCGIKADDIYIVDSSSTDNTVAIARKAGFKVRIIKQSEFGHGKTRAEAVEDIATDILVFMTQDVLPATNDAILKLCTIFEKDNMVGAVYGRQLPYESTDAFGKHARLFNYPAQSRINTLADRNKRGIKTAFLSDSFAAYKREILVRIGNFPKGINFGEDTVVAAKMLLAGYKTFYCAEAKVYHSHTFSCYEEFKRYELIGKFHKQESWLLKDFGKAEGEGFKFVKSEFSYLIREESVCLLPPALLRNIFKYLGYFYGKRCS
jgi:rhamnosyltransferase